MIATNRAEEQVISNILAALNEGTKVQGFGLDAVGGQGGQGGKDAKSNTKLEKYYALRIALAIAMRLEYKSYEALKGLYKEGALGLKAERTNSSYKDEVIETSGLSDEAFSSFNVMKIYLAINEGRIFSDSEAREALKFYIHMGLKEIDASYRSGNNLFHYLSEALFLDAASGSEGISGDAEGYLDEVKTQDEMIKYHINRLRTESDIRATLASEAIKGPRQVSYLLHFETFNDKERAKKFIKNGGLGSNLRFEDSSKQGRENDFYIIFDIKDEASWARLDFETFLKYNDKARGTFVGLDMLNKPIYIDFGVKSDSEAHALIGGGSGSGKSSLARLLLVNFIKNYSKEELQLYIFDPKNEFSILKSQLERTGRGKVIAGETRDFITALEALVAEMKLRQEDAAYAKSAPTIIALIDEASSMLNIKNKALKASTALIEELLRRARSARIKLLLFDQNISSENTPQAVRANLTRRIALRVTSASQSSVLIDEGGAKKLLGKGDMLIKNSEDASYHYAVAPNILMDDVARLLE